MSAAMDDEPSSPSVNEFIAEIERVVDEIRARPGCKRKSGLLVLKKDARGVPSQERGPEDE